MDPFPAPSRSCFDNIQRAQIDEIKIDADKVRGYLLSCQRILNKGSYAILLAGFYKKSEWMKAFTKAEFVIKP